MGSGDRIRLRLVNPANGRVFRPSFAGLDAKVIAMDGMYLREPISPVGLEIAPGNRVDLDISLASASSSRIGVRESWMLHCHFLEHAEAGMMTTIEVRNSG